MEIISHRNKDVPELPHYWKVIYYATVPGDPAEFIEIFDGAEGPSYTIAIDDNCRLTKLFDRSVLEGQDVVTVEITISETQIVIYING